ncbi:hypothetical protein LEP1GSC137_4569 [Leptospira borgpetersenii str. Noumea 25]|uniref:Uncharacterized protein n=2 Tax=Leptospira borgpetersenii TaxID=174 RepID=M3GIX8_LEPBO|nr:hypothetical protein LEP1GSC121_0069 [Leptospira borgpetersenii serovar Castellonis str. 200801910]EMG00917.1 hypothetical protein LEP1GSC123_3309 [Leptospira borgpetersenii str. 200701203]EMK14383.1 hypothetical protein LEP1GSC066_0588 [Leptospira sp. serovar Kenya str. Sh9]EMN13051.1 hypothetical protein LEP1GSC055_2014 [Leptospira borgpetersenii str. Brem 307]EMN16302.1 hypothetical protein LEP1GSC056_0064 [Leptospira borgpetersenii str. Brem 328]EMO10986.1 hypothetical protein LEP1GSC13
METGKSTLYDFIICLIHSGNGTDLKRMFRLLGTSVQNFIL